MNIIIRTGDFGILTEITFEYIIKVGRKLSQMFVATRYATKTRSSSNVSRYSICDSSRDRVQMLRSSIRENGVSLLSGDIEQWI